MKDLRSGSMKGSCCVPPFSHSLGTLFWLRTALVRQVQARNYHAAKRCDTSDSCSKRLTFKNLCEAEKVPWSRCRNGDPH